MRHALLTGSYHLLLAICILVPVELKEHTHIKLKTSICTAFSPFHPLKLSQWTQAEILSTCFWYFIPCYYSMDSNILIFSSNFQVHDCNGTLLINIIQHQTPGLLPLSGSQPPANLRVEGAGPRGCAYIPEWLDHHSPTPPYNPTAYI